MRILFVVGLALTSILSISAPVDARQGARSHGNQVYGYRRGSSAECDRARDADPGGNYSDYPCWAQWALSPKRRGG
jgi:hypothetical protein